MMVPMESQGMLEGSPERLGGVSWVPGMCSEGSQKYPEHPRGDGDVDGVALEGCPGCLGGTSGVSRG